MRPVAAIILIAVLNCTSGQTAGGSPEAEKNPQQVRVPLLLRPLDALAEAHANDWTRFDGPRCPMYPSCAAYARRAVREEGLLGVLLFINRLFFAETGDLSSRYILAPRRLSGHPRYFAPLADDVGTGPSLWQEDFR